MAEEKKKMMKYYNPYPFLVRVLNDLKEKQVLAPQGHCKVRGGEYDQSPLELLPLDKRTGKKYRRSLGINLRRLQKADLINLAWAVMVAKRDELEKMSQKDLIKRIEEKTGEKSQEKEAEKEPEKEQESSQVEDKKDSEAESTDETADESGEDELPPDVKTEEDEEKEKPKLEEEPVEEKKSGRKKIDLDEEEDA